MVAWVFDPDAPLHDPLDPSDLLACARTVAMAPGHLRPALDQILQRFYFVVTARYTDRPDLDAALAAILGEATKERLLL